MKVDILAFAAHPDDIEISCGATICKHVDLGKRVAIVDFTRGELGTRGSGELRLQEAEKASQIMGIHARENLGFRDGFFVHDEAHILEIVKMIRKYQPEIILANTPKDRHPDHGRASKMVSEACFLSGLARIETNIDGESQERWRPKALYYYIQDLYQEADFAVDVSDYMDKKIEVLHAFSSQFHDPNSKEPQTPISGDDFFEFIKARMKDAGRSIGVKYAEGFIAQRLVGVESLDKMM